MVEFLYKIDKMMGSEFTDKVMEYRIINEQLMSKAMDLLKTADELMINQESDNDAEKSLYDKSKKCVFKGKSFIDDLEDSTVEFSKAFDDLTIGKNTNQEYLLIDNDVDVTDDTLIQNEAFDAFMKTKDKVKSKFNFPIDLSSNKDLPIDFESIDKQNSCSVDGHESEESDINGIKNAINQHKESDSMVKSLINTKFLLQNNTKEPKMTDNIQIDQSNCTSKVNDQCIRFLKQKIEALQDEIKSHQENIKKKTTEFDKLSKENQLLLDAKTKLTAQLNTLKSQVIKKDEKIVNLNSKIQAAELECRSVKCEQENLLKASKEAAHDISNAEVKLSRALKEINVLKEAVATNKKRDKEMKESFRKQMDESVSSIKAFEKKEKDFETAIKKQALLIDNLKKQILYLTTQKNVNIARKQLDSLLNMEYK